VAVGVENTAVSSSTLAAGGVNGTSVSSSMTLTITSANALVGSLTLQDGTATPTSVTAHWDSAGTNQPMTLIKAIEPGNGLHAFLFGLLAPTAGTNLTLLFSWTGGTFSEGGGIGLTGVDQTSFATSFPHATTNSGTSQSPSVVVTTSANNGVVGAGIDGAGGGSGTGVSNTTLFNVTDSNSSGSYVSNYKVPSVTGSVTLSYSIGVSSSWVYVGTDVLATGGGGGATATSSTLTLMGVG
jgi:hypothetical protein